MIIETISPDWASGVSEMGVHFKKYLISSSTFNGHQIIVGQMGRLNVESNGEMQEMGDL